MTKQENRKFDKKQEYRDNDDRIAVERAFTLEKHSYGLGLAKLDETIRSSIELSVLEVNVNILVRWSRHSGLTEPPNYYVT